MWFLNGWGMKWRVLVWDLWLLWSFVRKPHTSIDSGSLCVVALHKSPFLYYFICRLNTCLFFCCITANSYEKLSLWENGVRNICILLQMHVYGSLIPKAGRWDDKVVVELLSLPGLKNVLMSQKKLYILDSWQRQLMWREREREGKKKHYCKQTEINKKIEFIWFPLTMLQSVLIIPKSPGGVKSSTGKTKGQHFSISLRGWDPGPPTVPYTFRSPLRPQ